jgi:hypothetical protein
MNSPLSIERKLRAILAAQVVGYSALMEKEEPGTFERLQAGRRQTEQDDGRCFALNAQPSSMPPPPKESRRSIASE